MDQSYSYGKTREDAIIEKGLYWTICIAKNTW